jgi:tRNA G18 (ribose-2'-O)-methylase SpoU
MQRIESIDDPRVAAYRNLRDRTLRGESIFVAEGRLLTARLLQSSYATESVFLADEFVAEFEPLVPAGVPIYVAAEPLLLEIVGFPFHRGALAVGRRGEGLPLDAMVETIELGLHAKLTSPPPPPGEGRGEGSSLTAKPLSGQRALTPGPSPASGRGERITQLLSLVICPEITKPENMGLIFRTAAGLGVDGIVLGERCCDPFSRRCLRVSMGGVLRVPFVKSQDLTADLRRLRDQWHVELFAATLDPAAEQLSEVGWPPRAGLLFGNEYSGLDDATLGFCPRRVTIPMHLGTDSLNLGVAAGIFIYELQRSQTANRR